MADDEHDDFDTDDALVHGEVAASDDSNDTTTSAAAATTAAAAAAVETLRL